LIFYLYLDIFVLVSKENHDREAEDDDALEDEEDGPQDPVQGHDARRSVGTALTAGGTFETLEGLF
jgi:hypothetical protein